MSNQDLAFLTLAEAADRLQGREVSSVELTQNMLDRIAELDPQLNAFITVLSEAALASARKADETRSQDKSVLHGVPIALKDLYNTAGVRTTGGGRILAHNVPDEDATVVKKLQASGAVILGKTNMMEFAYGYPHPDFGETRNPWDPGRTAGGSSGGSAAAVVPDLPTARLGATPAAQFAARPPIVVSAASSRPTAGSRVTVCCPSPGRSITRGH